MKQWVAFDLETSGTLPEYALQPWRVRQNVAWITTIGTAWRNGSDVLTWGVTTALMSKDEQRHRLQLVLQAARDKKQRLVCWNTTFDCAWCIAYELEQLVMECDWLDAMLLWKHVDNEPTAADNKKVRSFGLKKYVDTYTDRGGYEFGVDYHDTSSENLAKLLRYCKDDCKETLLAAEQLWAKLNDRQRRLIFTEAAVIPLVASANERGVRCDLEAAQMLDAKLDLTRAAMHGSMAKLGVTEDIVRSPKKLATLLYKKWGLPVIKTNEPTAAERKKAEAEGREPVGLPSTDKEALHELAVDYPKVDRLGRWREAMNLRTKFVASIMQSCEYNGQGDYSHPEGTILGTYTGRLTIKSFQGKGVKTRRQTGFALHQTKRGSDFRNMLIAPEGCDMWEFDAAGQEYRWMAVESGDAVMLDLCARGQDMHAYMAAAIDKVQFEDMLAFIADNKDAGKKKRTGGKVANFSLSYRTSHRTLRIQATVQFGMPMTEDEAIHIHSTYRKTYPGVPIYWKRQVQLGRANRGVVNLAGRHVALLGDWDRGSKSAYPQEQTAINFPIQSVGADQKYLGLRMLKPLLTKYNAGFAMDLHDGLFFYVPKDRSMQFGSEAFKVLNNLPYKAAWGLDCPIPMPWDASFGPAWGSLKGFHG